MIKDSKELAVIAKDAVEDKKAVDVTLLDISGISLIADYFIICTGNSETHAKAIAENVLGTIEEMPLRKEGIREGKWILLDYGSVVVHIFQREERLFYDLERLWGDADVISEIES
ncbi:ribosome-associated protein [Desulfitispora alkaliphila]|uniref:ribosome silencing factor n=1 Tax=Desulfitispora alkaliphila TaxID=622674 RepID=UPI003D1D95B2